MDTFPSNTWNLLHLFQSTSHTQKFLQSIYNYHHIEESAKKSYEKCYPFMYYLEQGELYYTQAMNAPFSIKPMLLFYGLVHLLKACVLTVDPSYPKTTNVLAHGVTSRKRKKQNYRFSQDTVKIQKHGLLPHLFEKIYFIQHFDGEKISMGQLLEQIPELAECHFYLNGFNPFITIEKEGTQYKIPSKALDHFYMTPRRMKEFLNQLHPIKLHWKKANENEMLFTVEGHAQLKQPFRYNVVEKKYVLPCNKTRVMLLPEIIIHYLLLYNLSMISRYETEWWKELIKLKPTNDYPMIDSFLNITMNKSPALILSYLQSHLVI